MTKMSDYDSFFFVNFSLKQCNAVKLVMKKEAECIKKIIIIIISNIKLCDLKTFKSHLL